MPAALSVLVLIAALPKLRSFVQICALFMLSLNPKPPLAQYPEFRACLATIFSNVVPQVKKLFVTFFKDLYVYWVPQILIAIPHAASPGLGHMLSCGIPKIYSSTL
jgi:hypothetical protein